MPQRIQRKRTKGFKMPPDTIYVGRPTKWGNPFKVGEPQYNPNAGQFGLITPQSVTQCLELYKTYVNKCMNSPISWMAKDIHELRGKNLACFCSLDQKCHADILLEIANS